VRPEDFGAIGNGVTNDGPAFQLAINTGKPLSLDGSKTYRIASAVQFLNRNAIVFGNGAKVVQGANFHCFEVKQDFTNVTSVSALAHANYTFPNGSTNTLSSNVTIASTANFAINDICKIVSDDLLSGPEPADNERSGQFVKVGDKTGTVLYFYDLMRAPRGDVWSTNIRVAKMSKQYVVHFENIVFDVADGFGFWNNAQLKITGAYKPTLLNLRSLNSSSTFINLTSCLQTTSWGIRHENGRTSIANTCFGYSIVEYCCESSTHYGLHASQVRHAYTTGTLSSNSNDSRIENYGRTAFTQVIGGTAINCQHNPWDTHADAFRIDFIGCVGRNPFSGPDGSATNFAFRGIGCRAINCESYGGLGYRVLMDYGDANNSGDHEFIDCYHEFSSLAATVRNAFSIGGTTRSSVDYLVTGVRIVNPRVRQPAGQGAIIALDRTEYCYIDGGHVQFNTTTGAGRVFDLTKSSNIFVDGIACDMRSSTGTNYRIIRLADTASSIDVNNMKVLRGSSSWEAVVDFNSLDGTCRVYNLKADSLFSSASGKANAGAGSTFLCSLHEANGSLYGSANYNPNNLADGAGETTTVTVTGAALGDYVDSISFSLDLQGILLTAWVSSANTVSVRFQNETGGAIDLASGTLRAVVTKRQLQ
jgi:hypothetical protein